MVEKRRSKEELKGVKNGLKELAIFAEKRAKSLTKKESALYLYMDTLSKQATEMLKLGHYPTLACVDRLIILVKECDEEALKAEVIDFRKILITYK